jgi:hypothetical protein
METQKNTDTAKANQPASFSDDLDLVGQFNAIFHGVAEATVKGKEIFITIGNRTMVVQLPSVLGGQQAGPRPHRTRE